MTSPQHFLDLADLEAAQLRQIIDAAHQRKAARLKDAPKDKIAGKVIVDEDKPLSGHVLAMIFDKASTRTRLSFDMAMRQLGGETIILNSADMQLGRGESIADTARVLSRFADAVMIRTGAHETIAEFAAHATIPVINGLTALSHPCQIVADIQTFEEHKGAIKGRKIAWFGDGNNVAISFIQAACLLDFELCLAVPETYQPPKEIMNWAAAQKGKISITQDPLAAATGADALITDCWVSLNDDPATAQSRAHAFAPYQVTEELMAQGNEAIFMHCLPAYRGKEVTEAVIDGAASLVFDEAENRIHAQKSILTFCFGVEE